MNTDIQTSQWITPVPYGYGWDFFALKFVPFYSYCWGLTLYNCALELGQLTLKVFYPQNRLYDIEEQVILFLHRFSVFSLSLSLTTFCCSQNVGVCRPLPLYYYLGGMPHSSKFAREPVSSFGNVVLIVAVLTLQACIEWKKYQCKKLDQESILLSKFPCLN